MHQTQTDDAPATHPDSTPSCDGQLPLVTLPPARVSRLAPTPTIPSWGRDTPSGPSRQRYFFVAVRRGHQVGVYNSWPEAEKQIIDHPCPSFKTFSTRLAAEAFVAGWDGAGRHSLPSSSPRPLREHLAMNFPHAVPLPTVSGTSRPSYHARLISEPAFPTAEMTDFGPTTLSPRPDLLLPRPASYRHSLVRVSSPLRQQVDETDSKQNYRKTTSLMNIAGMLSPPTSPDLGARPPPVQTSVMNRERPIRGKSASESGTWSSNQNKFVPKSTSALPSPPQSPPLLPAKKPVPKRTASGMWADLAVPAKPSSLSPLANTGALEVDISANLAAPKFSRSALKKAGVVMPVSAPRSSSSSSLRSKTSTPSLRSSPSNSSLSSLSSIQSNSKSSRRQSSFNPQDRLSSLAETSKRELQLNEEGLLALDALSPPRPAFMHRKSNSSLSSLSSMTSGTSAATSTLDSCLETVEDENDVNVAGSEDHDVAISCTKSDADADGSVESTSMKSGFLGKEKKKGGLFKRLSKALKLEKKSVPGQEVGRRGSL